MLIQKIENKLVSRKSKYLSFGGRLVSVNFMIISLPLYYFVHLLRWVVNKIEKLINFFLWAGASSSSALAYYKLSWTSTCLRKDKGGLGIEDIKQLNIALLVKWD